MCDLAHSSGNQTSYVAVVGPNCAWSGAAPRKLADFRAEAANTILLVEVAKSGICWAEPKDISLDALAAAGTSSAALIPSSGHLPESNFFFTYDPRPGINVAMANGSVRYLPPECLTPDRLPKLLQIGGCKQSEIDSLAPTFEERLNWPNIAALAVWLLSVGTLLTRAVRSRKKLAVPATPPAG